MQLLKTDEDPQNFDKKELTYYCKYKWMKLIKLFSLITLIYFLFLKYFV